MRLAGAAVIAFAAHLLAALGSLMFLQPGTPVDPDVAVRQAFVATHLATWRLGWVFWTTASLSLVLVLFQLHRPSAILAACTLPLDLGSQLIFAIPLWRYETLAYVGTGVIANALYTIALAWALWRAQLPRWLAWSGAPVIVAGVAVSIASWTRDPTQLFASLAALSATMILWTGLLGAWAWRGS